ncbi:hypothetical protein BH11MYX2_BH11MYX2_16210 [soil metagenome]
MRLLVATLAIGVLGACGPSNRPDNGGDDAGAPDAPDATGSDDGGTNQVSRVYAHTAGVLYQMNAATLTTTMIGAMSGLDASEQVLDLAVDKNNNVTGITSGKFYSLSTTTGHATLLGTLTGAAQNSSSLGYVPDPSGGDDILLSANDVGDVFKITISGSSASAAKVGNYGKTSSNKQISSSGDIFGIATNNFGIYATVNVAGETNDYLAKIDPTNQFKATLLPNNTGFDHIFGLGFWGGKIYGFIDNGTGGTMIQIDPLTGIGSQITTGTERWYGAGVATTAPVIF